MRTSLALASLTCALTLMPGQARADDLVLADFEPQVDEFVRAEMQREQVPGVAIGIFQHGEIVMAKGYGDSNVELQVPVNPETMFQSGSVGKQFTAMAVMLQVEAGKLSLADPLTKFFPEAPAAWGAITVRHLLTHTSGLTDLEGMLDYRKD